MKHITKLLFTFLTLLFFQYTTTAQQLAKTQEDKLVELKEDGTWRFVDSVPPTRIYEFQSRKFEIPKLNSYEKIITHEGYSLVFNEIHKQAKWVAYELTKEETQSKFSRTNNFIADPEVKSGTANDLDYKGSGYDRGHLAPAGDMGWSGRAMEESFYYSNMSPQVPSFNRGIWKSMEELVRTWAVQNEAVYVVSGPVLKPGLNSIGQSNVSVPKYYYKVILDYREPELKGIGFILPNRGSKEQLQRYAVSIDSVEKFTGIDFFPKLPIAQAVELENRVCINCWEWKSSNENKPKVNKASQSVQCEGITKAGNRCKNKTLNVSKYCYLHESQNPKNTTEQIPAEQKIQESKRGSTGTVQCSGITKSGNRCKRMTTSPSGRCYQH